MAIIYSYPKVTTPLATDVLVLTDTTLRAGKRKNQTKSLAMSDLASYVISSTSAITGGGTFNTIPLWTPDGLKLGNSIITQASTGQGVTVTGQLEVTDDFNVTGSTELFSTLSVQGASTFSNVSFQGVVFDGGGNPGTAGQVLSSTGSGGDTEWINNTDANTTYNLFGATSNVNEYAISLSGSDGSLDEVNLIPGSNITLTSSATGVTINTVGSDINGSGTANSVPKWIDADTLADSIIVDNGSGVKIGGGSAQSGFMLDVNGQSVTRGNAYLQGRLQFFNSSPGYISNTTDIVIDVNASEKMRITSAGNVGIGTTSPGAKLHVEGNVLIDAYNQGEDNGLFFREGFLTIDQPSITVWDMSNSGTSPDGLSINSNDGIRFRENGGEVARFKDGSFGIGTTSPGAKLDVAGDIRINSVGQELQFSNDNVGAYRDGSNRLMISGYGGIRFQAEAVAGMENQATRMVINSLGNVGIGTTNPASKLNVVKDNSSGNALQIDNSGASRSLEINHNIDNSGTVDDIVRISSNGSRKMTIQAEGNVGIGTTSPLSKLQISSGSAAETTLTVGASGNIADVASRIFLNEGEVGVSNSTNYGFSLAYAGDGSYGLPNNTFGIIRHDNSAAGAIVLSAQRATGNVGIGTDSPASKLEVDGGDIEVGDSGSGLILKSANGSRWRQTISNTGVPVYTQV